MIVAAALHASASGAAYEAAYEATYEATYEAAYDAADEANAGLPRYDHADPVALNEHALHQIRAGDIGTAVILLERAAQLAPHDARIRHNLDMLRAWRDGRPVPAQPAEEASHMSDAALPPFPLWPKK